MKGKRDEGYAPVPEYSRVTYYQPHWTRRKEITKEHPEIQKLFGLDRFTAVWVVINVSMLVALAWMVQKYNFSWLGILALSYGVGAFIMHAQWVLVHELTHDLVFKSTTLNTFFLLLCNTTHIVPSGISFRYFHRQHHAFLNETYKDPDVPSEIEDKIFGHTILGKATWLCFFAVFQTIRLLRAPQPFEWATFFQFRWQRPFHLRDCGQHRPESPHFPFALVLFEYRPSLASPWCEVDC